MDSLKCPICEIDNCRFLYDKERDNNPVRFVICKECGLVYQNPMQGIDDLEKYYSESFRKTFDNEDDLSKYIESRIEHGNSIFQIITKSFFNKKFNSLKRKIQGNKCFSVLDIGCGIGGILVPFIREGFVCKGIDTPSMYTQLGKDKLNIDISEVFLSKFETDIKYDIVILNHTLEHFSDPVIDLKKISRLLKRNGLLYVEVPNIEKPYNWTTLQFFFLLGHLFYYSPKTLEIICNKAGFENIYIDDITTPFIRAIFKKKFNNLYSVDSEHYANVYSELASKIKYENDNIG